MGSDFDFNKTNLTYDNSAFFSGKKNVTFLEHHSHYYMGESLQDGI